VVRQKQGGLKKKEIKKGKKVRRKEGRKKRKGFELYCCVTPV
jgi:hypothetical protein